MPFTTISKQDKRNVFKDLLLYSILLILPQRYSRSYLVLSFLAFVYRHKHKQFKCENIDVAKLNYLLDVSLNNDILLLPNYYHWIWKNDLLNQQIEDRETKCKLLVQDVLKNDKAVIHHLRQMADKLISDIPCVFKIKLWLYDTKNKTNLKNDLVYSLMYNF